jgi:AmiR/NasT family two-component response regulator
MRGYAVTEQESFDLLRVTSQQLHRKLHDVAEDVIDTGVLPEWPVGRTSAQASAI